MTRINPDDPKWTAYVFGELDEAERAAVEHELESSEEARMLVEELRFAADLTKMELREAVPVAPLSTAQRQKIHESASAARPRRWFQAPVRMWATGLAAAAVIALAVVLPLKLKVSDNVPSVELNPISIAEVQPAEARKLAESPAGSKDPAKAESDFGLRYDHDQSALIAPPMPAAAPAPARAMADAVNQIAPAHTAPAFAEPAAVAPGLEAARREPPVVEEALKEAAAAGRVFGTVKDATAALIPGVGVTATNTETGATAKTVTDAAGAFALDGLQPGNYRLSSSLPGFQTNTRDGIQLGANAQAKQDMTLQVGQVNQSVEVAVAADMVSRRGAGGAAGPAADAELRVRANNFTVDNLNIAPGVSSRAPGVPPTFDRTRPGLYNGAESYDRINDNPFLSVGQNPLSTFSIDVDTASYSNVRRLLNQNQIPPRDAVRIEEMINYFPYDYPQPQGNNPIGASIEVAPAPWSPQHRLVRVAIKARDLEARRRPASNLVFLLDVSGSMEPEERLPLLKNAVRMLVDQLNANDRVTVVTYAGTTGVALRPTRGDQKDTILQLIGSLKAGGSTNGASGIQLAYEQAAAGFIPGGVNRVILATDGDFNVGITNDNALLRLIEDKARTGVFLTVLGVGMGNYKDARLEMLADKGNGNFAYIDTLNEARKVLVDQMSSTLVTMAKDVKVQVEFNPAVVDAYRLIGYENRALRNEDFNNDLKDAGEMGAGQTVTVLYQVVPRGVPINTPGAPGVDPLRYQAPAAPLARNALNETLTVKVRYQEPSGGDSRLLEFPVIDRQQPFAKSSVDFRFAAAVASFGMILRDSPHKGTSTINSVLSIAEDSLGSDRNGYRREFLQLVQRARQIRGRD